MLSRAKITKNMIVNAAFVVACESGVEKNNAHTVSQKLGVGSEMCVEKRHLHLL